MQEFVERLHNNSQRFVPILDPGIPLLPGFPAYEDGLKRGIFITDVTGQPYIAEVGHPPTFALSLALNCGSRMLRCFHA